LIVAVMGRDEIGGAQAVLHLAQPRVPRAPCGGLRRIGAEAQLAQLERQTVLRREFPYHLSNFPTFHLNPVIHMRHDERQPAFRSDTVQ